jgi:hypothetical protein
MRNLRSATEGITFRPWPSCAHTKRGDMTKAPDLTIAGVDAIRQREVARGLTDPLIAYAAQLKGASARGIEFQLTFSEWWSVWAPYYHLRGQGKNGLVMGRNNDVGPYALGNIYLTTRLGNTMDYHRTELAVKHREEQRLRREQKKAQQWRRGKSGRSIAHNEDEAVRAYASPLDQLSVRTSLDRL